MLEKEVLISVGKRLDNWERSGEVPWFERLNSGRIKTTYGAWVKLCRSGTPDFVAIVRNKALGLDLLFIECKRPDGKGRLSDVQLNFQDRYKNVKNIHYLVIEHPNCVDSYINDLAYDRVNEINL